MSVIIIVIGDRTQFRGRSENPSSRLVNGDRFKSGGPRDYYHFSVKGFRVEQGKVVE